MGIGGNLMWKALAREMYKKKKKPVLFIGKKNKILDYDIFKHNPYITFNKKEEHVKINLVLSKLPEQISKKNWDVNRHTIVSRCEHFKVKNPEIKCDLFFSKDEENKIKKILEDLPDKFIVIEPHAKTSWCEHKQYPLEKWQKIVDSCYKDIPIVQMSLPGKKVLNNVIDISSKINNFREACLLIKYSELFISTEGGLMHGCNAVNKKCIIIFAPLFHPKYTKYENVIDIWVKDNSHFNCFKVGKCLQCIDLMKNHDESIVINKLLLHIRPFYSGSPVLDY